MSVRQAQTKTIRIRAADTRIGALFGNAAMTNRQIDADTNERNQIQNIQCCIESIDSRQEILDALANNNSVAGRRKMTKKRTINLVDKEIG